MQLKQIIDAIGVLKEQIKEAEAKIKSLETNLPKTLEIGIYDGNVYKLSVSERVSEEIDSEKTLGVLGTELFLKVTKVLKTELVKHLSKSAIDKLVSEYKVTLVKSYPKK